MKFSPEGIPELEPLTPEQQTMVPFVAQAWSPADHRLCEGALRQVVADVASNRPAVQVLDTAGPGTWLAQPLKSVLYLAAQDPSGARTLPFLVEVSDQLHGRMQRSEVFRKALRHFHPSAEGVTSASGPSKEWHSVLGVVHAAALHHCITWGNTTPVEGWFYRSDAPDGFFAYRGDASPWEMRKSRIWNLPTRRPRLSLHESPLPGGWQVSIRARRCSDGGEDSDWEALKLEAMALDDQRQVCAFAEATLFEPPGVDADLDELFSVADLFSQEQADMAHDMLRQRPPGLCFALSMGQAVLHLEDCEVRRPWRGQRLGGEVVRALMARARRLARGPVFVVASVHPKQFPRRNYERVDATLRTAYLDAMDRLTNYLSEACDGKLFPADAQGQAWTARNATYIRSSNEGLGLLAQHMLKTGEATR